MGLLLTAPAGNDLPFDEALCEQGRNFNNKIWNAFRLVKGWETADIEQTDTERAGIEWFYSRLFNTVNQMDELFSKYRISEALMEIYKLFWDEFSAWYLEIAKPEYGKPISRKTYESTLYFFDCLLRLLHPFMPFITEELWQNLAERKEGESIMIAAIPATTEYVCQPTLDAFETVKDIIAGIRTVRLQKNIGQREPVELYYRGEHDNRFDGIIRKLGIVTKIAEIAAVSNNSDADKTKLTSYSPFMVETTEYNVPVEINVEEEIARMRKEIAYQEGFIESVMKKLGNEKFVANAKPEVVANERKKKADAESKIMTLREGIDNLNKYF